MKLLKNYVNFNINWFLLYGEMFPGIPPVYNPKNAANFKHPSDIDVWHIVGYVNGCYIYFTFLELFFNDFNNFLILNKHNITASAFDYNTRIVLKFKSILSRSKSLSRKAYKITRQELGGEALLKDCNGIMFEAINLFIDLHLFWLKKGIFISFFAKLKKS